MRGTPRVLAIALCASCCAPPAGAQEPDPPDDAVELDAVEVVGARRPLSGFPGAGSVVAGAALGAMAGGFAALSAWMLGLVVLPLLGSAREPTP